MTTMNIGETRARFELALANAGVNALSAADAYEKLVFILQSFVQINDYDETPSGYLKAAEDLRDHSFPKWPLAGMPYDSSCLPPTEEVARSIARAIGIYLSVALEESSNHGKVGAEKIDVFLEESGLLTSDVSE